MTVRELRKLRQENRLRIAFVPEPPPEWTDYRRERMKLAVECACLYLWQQLHWNQIVKRLDLPVKTRQRVQQLVKKGARFLEERGAIEILGER